MNDGPTFKVGIIARVCDLSETHLRRLVKEGVISGPSKRGQWPITNVTEYIHHLRGQGAAGSSNDGHFHKIRKLKEEADKLEMENAEKRGLLAPVDQMALVWGAMLGNLKNRLLGMGAKLGPVIAPESRAPVCQTMIDGEIHEALIDLADYDPETDPALIPGAGNGDTPTLRRKTLRKSRHRLTDKKFDQACLSSRSSPLAAPY